MPRAITIGSIDACRPPFGGNEELKNRQRKLADFPANFLASEVGSKDNVNLIPQQCIQSETAMRHRATRRFSLLLTAVTTIVAASSASAQSTWTGAASGSWANAANWSPNGVPASSQNTQLTFGVSANPAMFDDIAGTFTLNRMTFNAGDPAYSLAGNPLAFQSNTVGGAPALVDNSAATVSIGD